MATAHLHPTDYLLPSLASDSCPSIREIVLYRKPYYDGFGIYIGDDVPSGLYIVTIESGSPAADANILPGDRIIALNGQLISTIENSKENLFRTASHSQTLRLTIQSTSIYNDLNIPLTNNHTEKKKIKSNKDSSARLTNTNTDLQSYLQSIFANEEVQIVSSSNKNEFFIQAGSNPRSSEKFSSNISSSFHSKECKSQSNLHRERKQKSFVTRETQTSMDEEDEIPTQEPPPILPVRSYPSMGTSHRLLRTQQTIPNDNITTHTDPVDPKAQHLANIVQAAVVAQRKRKAKDSVAAIVSQQNPTPSSLPENESSAIVPAIAPLAFSHSPPPYTVTDTHLEINNKQESTDEGSYNVRDALANRSTTTVIRDTDTISTSITGTGVRAVHLQRRDDFDGFGFHLKYNNRYFIIHSVEEDSPAKIGGLSVNDVILAVNQHLTETMPHSEFITIVNNNSEIELIVQPIKEYMHRGQQAPENEQLTTVQSTNETVPVSDSSNKSGFSRILSKITKR